ncbi:MAG: type II toxin-antitoxin system RelE/ParE family toxin [bacterium]|nr:type II toxin-antitoxin system RelE/ParE family toxin [bacterium]
MIQSFKSKETERLFDGRPVKGFAKELQKKALVRLMWLHRATLVEDLRVPPSNRLEALSGDLKGFHSIRVNRQFRILFRFEGGHAYDVALTDYH